MNKTFAHIVLVMAFAALLPSPRWTKAVAFTLEQGGGNIASTGPTGGAATYGQYHVDQYLGTGGATFISNPLKGSTPGTWDWSQGWGGATLHSIPIGGSSMR